MVKSTKPESEQLKSRDIFTVASLGFIPHWWNQERRENVAYLFDSEGKVKRDLVMTPKG
jgi:hypothetical protein